mmetsp:Transcript_37764/g.66469  ORF Transcript_37764/g.66469 Transcript_37764/m.66469 type:complete len:439 (-) Transcript_37764:72-1388(-)
MAGEEKEAEKEEEAEEDLPDFEQGDDGKGTTDGKAGRSEGAAIKATGFRDFLLKDDILKGIIECGFEHPSEVQHACIPQAVLGTDILCQAKSGMGKTAVFVLACLQLINIDEKVMRVLVLAHTRELVYQIQHEFVRLGKHLSGLKVACVYGGIPVEKDKEMLKKETPHILVGTPGKILANMKDGSLKLTTITHFILDECDKCLDQLDMRKDVQKIFISTPQKKQVMMFSATISEETRGICKKFMQGPHEITVEPGQLTLHGLLQYYCKLEERKKNKKLIDMLDALEFNQVVIFVRTVKRALALDGLLQECNFPSMTLHELPKNFEHKAANAAEAQLGRIDRFKAFKEFKKRILVTTDIFGRGIDVERVNIVINYDMPGDSDMYLHRVGRAGRFGTKGLAVSFIASEDEQAVMDSVQARFEVKVDAMPDTVDTTSYLNA